MKTELEQRYELVSIFLRVQLGTCPMLSRTGELCGLCQEAVDALGFEQHDRLFSDPYLRSEDAPPVQ